MTDTTISTGIVGVQDDGTGVPNGSEDYTSAGYFQLLSKYKGDGSYVGEDVNGSATMQFSSVDTSNNEFDLDSGYAYIMDGGHSVQGGAQSVYNVALPNESPYVVVLPSGASNIGLDSGTNDVWLAVDPTSNDSVYVRHGTGLSAPSDPSVKLGTVDSSSGSTTRANDLASPTVETLTSSLVNTDAMSTTGLADASTTQVWRSLLDSISGGTQARVQPTDGVGTSATTILDGTDNSGWTANAIVLVQGVDQADAVNRFYEWVHFVAGTASPTVQSTITSGSPAGRTYSRSGTNDLDLAMASGTYDVVASGLFSQRDN